MCESRLTILETGEFLQNLISSRTTVQFNDAKQSLVFMDSDGAKNTLTLPIVFPKIPSGSLSEILQHINQSTLSYTIILIQAGAAAIGYYEDAELVQHKVIKKYMVRKKQGKSQIKYLKSKGKSRLGSRIRLKNSIAFFEEINDILTQWNITEKSETILLFVPTNLKNLLFTANVPVPFDKKDPRIKKVPVDIRLPSMKELGHVNWLATRGTLIKQPFETVRSSDH